MVLCLRTLRGWKIIKKKFQRDILKGKPIDWHHFFTLVNSHRTVPLSRFFVQHGLNNPHILILPWRPHPCSPYPPSFLFFDVVSSIISHSLSILTLSFPPLTCLHLPLLPPSHPDSCPPFSSHPPQQLKSATRPSWYPPISAIDHFNYFLLPTLPSFISLHPPLPILSLSSYLNSVFPSQLYRRIYILVHSIYLHYSFNI